MSHFLSYALHYVIVRVIFDSLRGFGVREFTLAGIAVVALVVLSAFRKRRWYRPQKRETPKQAYEKAYARERARLDAQKQQRW